MMLSLAYSQTDSYPKALANFMFREIIEDAHAKYNISDEDMREMCKMAVNRAALYIALATHCEPVYLRAFAIHAADCTGWDDAEQTEDIEQQMDLISACVKVLGPGGKPDTISREALLKRLFPLGIPRTREDWNYAINARAVYEAIMKE